MSRKYLWLAVGVLFLRGSVGRADEPSAPMAAPEQAAPTATAQLPPGPAVETAPQLPPEASPAGESAPCCKCCASHFRGDCWNRLADWLTYCPPRTPCHFPFFGCACRTGCAECSCHQCTPCCMPPYMYFLDRCSLTLGFKGACCPPCCPPANAGPGPAPEGGQPSTAASEGEKPAPAVPTEPIPAPKPVPGK